jgi:hypothetical protein
MEQDLKKYKRALNERDLQKLGQKDKQTIVP